MKFWCEEAASTERVKIRLGKPKELRRILLELRTASTLGIIMDPLQRPAMNTLNRSMTNMWQVSSPLTVPSPVSNLPHTGLEPNRDMNGSGPAQETASTESPVAEVRSMGKKRHTQRNGTDSPHKKSKASSGGSSASTGFVNPVERLTDLGGIHEHVDRLLELVALPFVHPEIFQHTGIPPVRGVLLHGPPGCGKTHIAHALAGSLSVPMLSISAPSIVSGMSGESEKALRDAFEKARKAAPCIVFLDEIDAISGKREQAQREMERRIVAQLLTCMDGKCSFILQDAMAYVLNRLRLGE